MNWKAKHLHHKFMQRNTTIIKTYSILSFRNVSQCKDSLIALRGTFYKFVTDPISSFNFPHKQNEYYNLL
jgi:hypothetical protein